MKMSKIKIGDHVTLYGFDCIVCSIKEKHVGVRYEEPVEGAHDCGGACELGRGFWALPRSLRAVKTNE